MRLKDIIGACLAIGTTCLLTGCFGHDEIFIPGATATPTAQATATNTPVVIAATETPTAAPSNTSQSMRVSLKAVCAYSCTGL